MGHSLRSFGICLRKSGQVASEKEFKLGERREELRDTSTNAAWPWNPPGQQVSCDAGSQVPVEETCRVAGGRLFVLRNFTSYLVNWFYFLSWSMLNQKKPRLVNCAGDNWRDCRREERLHGNHPSQDLSRRSYFLSAVLL